MSYCCNDFTRSALRRRAAAEAGNGLPAIEDGMPLPAGTGLSRRSFLAKGVGSAVAIYGASKIPLPAFDDGIAAAATGPAQPVFVSVFLQGGADALTMLYPAGDPAYYKQRPTLAVAAGAGTTFAEDSRLRWHPTMAPLATLHGEGKVTVMPAVGYTGVDESHFTSRHYWEVGATDAGLRSGWLGRYLDVAGAPDNPLQGLSFGFALSPVVAPTRVPVASFYAPDTYRFTSGGEVSELNDPMLATLAQFGAYGDPALSTASSVAASSWQLSRQISGFAGSAPGAGYPQSSEPFPRQLSSLAQMLAMGLPIRCVALTAPGNFDTHSGQAAPLTTNLDLTMKSIYAFQRDIEARRIADRVLVHVWTEFGRRIPENGSAGTDHGAAGASFLIGTRVSGRMLGEFPGVANGMDTRGNMKMTLDFRSLYGAILEQWLQVDPAAVIPSAASFARPRILK